jgi:hypothetical protein
MSTKDELRFSTDRSAAITAMGLIDRGRGWCNVVPVVVDDVPDLKINISGLWLNHGVPVATLVTTGPKRGVEQPSSLGVLHSRGRLGTVRIRELLNGAPYTVRQDHNQRGLLLEVPVGSANAQILEVMASTTAALCEFEMTDQWRCDVFYR